MNAQALLTHLSELAIDAGRHDEGSQLVAIAQALADMRTLDYWRKTAIAPRKRAYEFDERGTLFLCEWEPFARSGQIREAFDGFTPDEARAKAAAWVRGQKRG